MDTKRRKNCRVASVCERNGVRAMAYIVPDDIPETCLECPFHIPCMEIGVGDGLYKKISHRIFAPEEIELLTGKGFFTPNFEQEYQRLFGKNKTSE